MSKTPSQLVFVPFMAIFQEDRIPVFGPVVWPSINLGFRRGGSAGILKTNGANQKTASQILAGWPWLAFGTRAYGVYGNWAVRAGERNGIPRLVVVLIPALVTSAWSIVGSGFPGALWLVATTTTVCGSGLLPFLSGADGFFIRVLAGSVLPAPVCVLAGLAVKRLVSLVRSVE